VQGLRTGRTDCGPAQRGARYISARTAELLASEVVGEHESEPHQELSERELQVFLRLAQGWTVSAIGESLHLSTKTISTYRSRLMEKMGLCSNAELAAYAVRHGLLSMTDTYAGQIE
jgi:DNA-binding NarL/FixJ family response regulator